jgi:uncharacterized delta-60 repeat protein
MFGICSTVRTGVFLFLLGAGSASAAAPQLAWTRSFNGPASEQEGVHDVAVRDGFLYVTGYTSLTNFTKGYITVKYAPDGTVAWSRIYEGLVGHANNDDRAFAVAVDANGDVYVSGYSVDYKIIDGREYLYVDVATLKYSAGGDLLWERRFRSSGGNAQPSAIAVDPRGFVYVGGAAWVDGGFDALLLKYDLDGNLLWSRNQGQPGHGWDAAHSMVLAPDGDIVLGGYTQPGDLDVYVVRFAPDGNLRWEWTQHGRSTVEEVWDVAVDGNGNTYAIAQYAPVDAFTSLLTVKLDPSGTLQWSDVYSGRSTGDYARGIELSPDGNIFAAGSAWENGSQTGLTLIKYSPGGQRLWSRSERGGYFSALCYDLAVDAEGSAYLTGFAFNDNNHEDFLTAKFTGAGNLAWTAAWSAPEDGSDLGYHVRVGSEGRVYVVGDSWRGFAPYYDITSVVYLQSGEVLGVSPPADRTTGFESLGPNPVLAGKAVTLHALDQGPVEVYDVHGRQVLRIQGGDANQSEGKLQFTAPSLPGIYMVRAGTRMRKLVVVGN